MPDCDTGVMHRYGAFISYSHKDAAFARKLHRRLEWYRLPRRLVSGRVGAARRLKPIFRDHEELAAAPDLSGAVKAALAESAYLIVICSAHAAASAWVAREVSLFRALHGEHAVLAVLVEGCSEASFRALLCKGGVDRVGVEPLAADFRRQGDGRTLAFLKLVAVLADVRLDALVQRDAQRLIRQVVLVSASAFAGVVALASLAVMTVEARLKADQEYKESQAFLRHQRDEVRNKLILYGRIDIINALDNGTAEYYRSHDVSRLSSADQEEYAKVLQDIGQDDESRGEMDDATLQFGEAYRLTSALLSVDATDANRIFAHAQSEYWMGENAWQMGRSQSAEQSFHAYARMADALARAEPGHRRAHMEQAYALSNLGTFFLRQKLDLKRAETYYVAALAKFSSALASAYVAEAHDPSDADITRESAEVYGFLGDVRRLGGDCQAAAAYRDHVHQILADFQKRDPDNTDLKSALVANKLALARIDLCQGASEAALEKLESGHEEAMALAVNDPKNADRHRQVRIFELFQVATWLTVPPATRPADNAIAGALGDCAAEATLRNNGELAEYCFVLQARRWMQLGLTEDARSSLNASRAMANSHTDALSPRWGLNFKEEEGSAAAVRPDVRSGQ